MDDEERERREEDALTNNLTDVLSEFIETYPEDSSTSDSMMMVRALVNALARTLDRAAMFGELDACMEEATSPK
jgi:hypothetical protein